MSAYDEPHIIYLNENGERLTLFSFFQELSEPVKKVLVAAWAARGKLLSDVKNNMLVTGAIMLSIPGRGVKVLNNPKIRELLEEEEDPEALAAVVFGTGTALCVGSIGAMTGGATGAGVGAALGAIPMLFTLGLSLPIGATLGAGAGLCTGVAVGGTVGFGAGASTGAVVAYFRREIRTAMVSISVVLYDTYDVLVVRPVGAVKGGTRRVKKRVNDTSDFTKAKAQAVSDVVVKLAANRKVQVSAAGAGAGAVALGSGGAVVGTLAGSTAGALVGLVPALFTFGLSIPIGAAVGGGLGGACGGFAGTTVGFAGGGAAGWLGYTFREVPGSAINMLKKDKAYMEAIEEDIVTAEAG